MKKAGTVDRWIRAFDIADTQWHRGGGGVMELNWTENRNGTLAGQCEVQTQILYLPSFSTRNVSLSALYMP